MVGGPQFVEFLEFVGFIGFVEFVEASSQSMRAVELPRDAAGSDAVTARQRDVGLTNRWDIAML